MAMRVWIPRLPLLKLHRSGGRLAQLGERIVRNDEAGGSIPPPSTKVFRDLHRLIESRELSIADSSAIGSFRV
jgi:hypothetical protein